MDFDESYISGLEMGILMVKQIFELTGTERERLFGTSSVPNILDRFDFAQIGELLKSKNEKQLKSYYIIRGIKVNKETGEKKCVVESERYTFHPRLMGGDVIELFIKGNTIPNYSPMIDFATVEEIWVLE